MTIKSLIPRTRIPKVVALCPSCGKGTKILTATPYAEGYHRRHRCRDIFCDHVFYTLATYDTGEVASSPLPFQDRALTEYEVELRARWWAEDADTYEVTTEVNRVPLLQRMASAIDKPEKERSPTDRFLVDCMNKVNIALADFEARQERNKDE